jgi:hypothetical protein
LLDCRGADDAGGAEGDEDGAGGVRRDVGFEGDGAQLIGGAAVDARGSGTHAESAAVAARSGKRGNGEEEAPSSGDQAPEHGQWSKTNVAETEREGKRSTGWGGLRSAASGTKRSRVPPRGGSVFFALIAVEGDDFGGGEVVALRHERDEAVVEIFGGIVAHFFEGLGKRGDLDETGHVAAGADVEFDVRDALAEDFVVVFLEAGALLDDFGRPFVERDDEVDAFVERMDFTPNISAMLMMPMPRHSM